MHHQPCSFPDLPSDLSPSTGIAKPGVFTSPKITTQFPSWEEWREYVKKELSVSLVKTRSTSVATRNATLEKCHRETKQPPLPAHLEIYSETYACSLRARPPSKERGANKLRRTACPFQLRATFIIDGKGEWRIQVTSSNGYGHDHTESLSRDDVPAKKRHKVTTNASPSAAPELDRTLNGKDPQAVVNSFPIELPFAWTSQDEASASFASQIAEMLSLPSANVIAPATLRSSRSSPSSTPDARFTLAGTPSHLSSSGEERSWRDVQPRNHHPPMNFCDRTILVMQRSIVGCHELKREAKELGATIAVEVTSQLTDIVSAMDLEDTLERLNLRRLPPGVELHGDAWLRCELARQRLQSSSSQSKPKHLNGRASTSNETIEIEDSDDESFPSQPSAMGLLASTASEMAPPVYRLETMEFSP